MSSASPDTASPDEAPPDAASEHLWRKAALAGVATTLILMALSLTVVPVLYRRAEWVTAGDLWITVRAARFVGNGALGYVYEVADDYVALPFFAIVLAPAVLVADVLHLTPMFPYVIPRPTMWLVVGPWAMLSGTVLIHAASSLASDFGDGRRPPAPLILALCAAVLAPLFYAGHPEDALAVALGCYALRAGRRTDVGQLGLLLGLAIGFKQLAIAFVPVVVFMGPRRWARLFAVLAGVAVPGAVALLCLAVDPDHAAKALFHPVSHPGLGHGRLAPWVDAAALSVTSTPGRTASVALAGTVALVLLRRCDARAVLACGALALAARLLLEPVVLFYYAVPAVALLLVHAFVSTGRIRRTAVAAGALIVVDYLPIDRKLGWFVHVVMVVVLVTPALRELTVQPRGAVDPSRS